MSQPERFRLYEAMFILKSTLGEESHKKAFDRICSLITDQQGEIKKTFDMSRRRLAYEIDEQREGHYHLIYFYAPRSRLLEINRELRFHEDLIRHIILTAEEVPEDISFKQVILGNWQGIAEKKGAKKRCPLSASGVVKIDYKDVEMLQHFTTEGGKILPARMTGIKAALQRQMSLAIKRARHMAILAFTLTE